MVTKVWLKIIRQKFERKWKFMILEMITFIRE